MMHKDQHTDAIAGSITTINQVTASIFDDKIKPMGEVTVSCGRIAIVLDCLPNMDEANQRDLTIAGISLALNLCWNAKPQAFNPHSQ